MNDQPIKRILVVDDEKSCRSMSQICLSQMGYLCDVASDASEALKKLSHKQFDLVLSDIRMKGKDGVQLMQEARRSYPHLDFIIMTGHTADYSYSDIVSAGATDYLGKPFEIGELRAKLERIQREKQVLIKLRETNDAHLWESQVNASVADLSNAILTSLPLEEVASLVVKYAKTLTCSPAGFIGTVDLSDGSLISIKEDFDAEKAGESSEPQDLKPLWYWLMQNRKPVLANEPNKIMKGSEIQMGRLTVRRLLSVPAMVGETTLGLVVLLNAPYDYAQKDLMLVERLANLFAIAIQRTRSDEELRLSIGKLRRTMEEIIAAMALAVETRDPYTAGHQRRVVDLACAITKEMGLPTEQVEAVRMAGIIHDLGKINIPAEILSKPGRLTDIEFALIKTHPETSYNILRTIGFPWPIAEIVHQHHERVNGSGYPKGLSGDGILFEAQILAVADVVEAMSSHRPYRAALGMAAALDEISRNRGILYNPAVVEACLEVVKGKGFEFS